MVFLIAGCGSSSDDSCAAPTLDLNGTTWTVNYTVTSDSCGIFPAQSGTVTFSISQSGSAVTILETTDEVEFNGSLCGGGPITVTGTFPLEGGLLREDLSLTVNGTSMSGSASWVYSSTNSNNGCTGSVSFNGSQTS